MIRHFLKNLRDFANLIEFSFILLYFLFKKHPEGPTQYMPPDVGPPPFAQMWNQEAAPPMVPYPELMGFPCTDLGIYQ